MRLEDACIDDQPKQSSSTSSNRDQIDHPNARRKIKLSQLAESTRQRRRCTRAIDRVRNICHGERANAPQQFR